MPTPKPSDYYTEPLESLLAELTVEQRKELADWIVLLTHYGRELVGRVEVGARLSENVLRRMNINDEADEVKNLLMASGKASETVKKNAEHLRHLFDTLQDTVAEYRSHPDTRHRSDDG